MLEDLINNFNQQASLFLNSGCIINGKFFELSAIENMKYEDFSMQVRFSVPVKLYKYFSNKDEKQKDGSIVNYSMQALKNNTVYMQSPANFDDVYDSDIYVDYSVFEKGCLVEYCRRCGISVSNSQETNEIGNIFLKAILDSLNKFKSYEHIFTKKVESKQEELENKRFCLMLNSEMQKTDDLGKAVLEVIKKDYLDFSTYLKNTFRVSCFTTTPYSQLMWGGAYADCHNGFCLEYTVLPEDKQYVDIFYNLFPMIYCKKRSDITSKFLNMKFGNISTDVLWNIYFHGVLRKSVDWVFQNEWRLLLPLGNHCEDYNLKFFPITKVFLGNRMSSDKRKEIIQICNERKIPYIGIKKNKDFFEMQECEIQCEKCLMNNQIPNIQKDF